MEKNKILLLRSYSRLTLASGCSSLSLPGLERLYPRTSTPYPDESHVTLDEEWFAPYGIFRRVLENPPKRARVRGMERAPAHFITGHLAKMGKDESFVMVSLDSSEVEVQKWDVKRKLQAMKRAMKNFFRKWYRSLIRNKCDFSLCPVTCECQKVKSLLNKTAFIDENAQETILKTL